ncbi:MAG TPA: hypothetical protein HPQ04_04005 [Rhodospirillaceae bacterium]|nr:hypothetical protein [Rhodospirillaceae bacterium]
MSIAELERRKAQIEARLQMARARQAALGRKSDARCKIIVGGAVFAEAKADPAFAKLLRGILEERVADKARAKAKPSDRAMVLAWLDGGLAAGPVPEGGSQGSGVPEPAVPGMRA